jgi:two-component system, cell cycle response regulator DivK
MNWQQKKILIIHDDVKNIFALKATLASRDYTCYTATSGKDGIDQLLNNPGMTIVLMDMMMPEMDRCGAMEIMKNDESLSVIPVIAVTGQAMVG